MIKYQTIDDIGLISLNRPEKRNALHPEMCIQITNLLEKLETEKSIKAIIITGEGTSFCAGADLENLNELTNAGVKENLSDSEIVSRLFLKLYNFNKPTFAAVNGPAIAGGCGLASVCDFIVADELKAKFGYSEVKIGFIPAIVSTFFIRRIGEGRALHYLLSGELFDAKRGKEIGFVNYISSNLIDETIQMAKTIGSLPQQSFLITKQMIKNISNLPVEDSIKYCLNLNTITRTTKDFKENLKTLSKKRDK
ncbi:MAG: enoyl-CoA hydratase/isomerase family protein [Ignavibacteriaceae bacterium]|nr:enoyl-CoA hydratase/isomerase family protein [Ignavibacteriaceae bacterium]